AHRASASVSSKANVKRAKEAHLPPANVRPFGLYASAQPRRCINFDAARYCPTAPLDKCCWPCVEPRANVTRLFFRARIRRGPSPMDDSAGISASVLEAVEVAEAAGLVYVRDIEPGIRRRRRNKGFDYVAPDGSA